MKIPVEWLKEYVKVPEASARLADLLTFSGTAVEEVTREAGSDVLHLEVTTNRPDCLSLHGVAAEVAALTGKPFKKIPVLRPKKPSSRNVRPLEISIQDKKSCPYYLGRVFTDVQTGPSSSRLSRRLEWTGQKSINNVVDITNFCLLETGQPLHAFDYDKIKGNKIIVRRARANEKITGLNDTEYTLDERILVIADAERAIAIAGVMGGRDTQVTASTRRVVLESAQFDPTVVRRATRFLKLTTESSHRFERGVDPGKVREASDRAADLLIRETRAVPASRPKSAGALKNPVGRPIQLRMDRVAEVLGYSVPAGRITAILKSLGARCGKKSRDVLKVRPPAGRADLKEEVDLIEEIARLNGFDKIPAAIPLTRHAPGFIDAEDNYRAVRRLKHFLAARGFYEAMTYSLVSRAAVTRSGYGADAPLITVRNPLSREQEVLRPALLPGLLASVTHNLNRRTRDVALFEAGKCFAAGREREVLALVLTGEVQTSWQNKKSASFYDLKGTLEAAFGLLRKGFPGWQEHRHEALSDALAVVDGQTPLAFCGIVKDETLKSWDIPQKVYYAEIDLDLFLARGEAARRFQTLPAFPAVRRDISVLVPEAARVGDMLTAMREAGKPFLTHASLFDQFKGSGIPKGRRSLAFALEYRKDGTFTDEEIRRIHDAVVSELKTRFSAQLR